MSVADRAYEVTQGNPPSLDHIYSFRYGMIYPVAFLFNSFGVNLFSLTLYPVLCSLGMIVVAFFLGRILFNEKVGLVAALLLSFYPLNVKVSTSLYADVPNACFASLSILLYVLGDRQASRRRSLLLYVLSGLVLGLSFLVRELAAILALFFIIDVLHQRRIARSHICIASAFLLVLAADAAVAHHLTGDWLQRYEVFGEGISRGIEEAVTPGYRTDQKWLYFVWFAIPIYSFGFFFYYLGAGSTYLVLKRTPNSWLPLAWFFALFGYLAFGPWVTRYTTAVQLPRYLCIVSVPVVLIISVFLDQNRHRLKGWFMHASVVFLFATSLFAISFDGTRHEPSYSDRRIREILGEDPRKVIYSDSRTIRVLKFLYGYQLNDLLKRYDDERAPIDVKAVKDSFIVVDRHRMWPTERVRGEGWWVFDRNNPPSSWAIYSKIDNPAPKLGYLQANLIGWVGQLPLWPKAIGRRLVEESTEVLEPGDAVIYDTGTGK